MNGSLVSTLIALVRRIKPIGRKLKLVYIRREYTNHPFLWYGILSPDEFKKYFIDENKEDKRDIYSYLSAERLGRT